METLIAAKKRAKSTYSESAKEIEASVQRSLEDLKAGRVYELKGDEWTKLPGKRP